MALTDAKLRALKCKPAPYKIADAEGMYVLVLLVSLAKSQSLITSNRSLA